MHVCSGSCGLSFSGVCSRIVKEKWKQWLPYVFMLLAALSRWPGLFPQNFSALYGLAFCAGAFFPKGMKWWLPFGAILVRDLCLDLYYLSKGYHVFDLPLLRYQLFNYVAFAVLIWLGKKFTRRASFLALLGGGLLGAILFYLITNTASWLFNPFNNPEYTFTLASWIRALTQGISGWPETWTFFINTLTSGGLFTALFAGALKLTEASESAREKEPVGEDEEAAEPEGESEPGKAA
jgi:Family of unknown function (DUF6580)